MRKIIFNESILDPVQRTRCRDIFDENDRIRPEVKSFIEDTFYKCYNELDYKPFKVAGFKLIGSSTGYQYTDISDIDVQVYCDMDPAIGDPVPYFKKMFRQLPNGNLLPGTSHPINYFQVDSENPPADIKVENRYDMATNVWEKKSDAREIGIPIQYVRDVAQFFKENKDYKVIAVGDGSNDAKMAQLADVGIAFGGVRKIAPSLLEVADYAVYNEDDLCDLLNNI